MANTTNLGLPFIDANQNQKYVTHNEALIILDALTQIGVQSAALSAPPASPADGQCWIVGTSATGAWIGKDRSIAAWQDGVWNFYSPRAGYLAFNVATAALQLWSGSAWISLLQVTGSGALTLGGVRTAVADANYTALAGDRYVGFASLTAARVVTLPAASAYPAGRLLRVADESGACNATRTITISRAGSDTINGGTSVALSAAYAGAALVSDGTAKWTRVA